MRTLLTKYVSLIFRVNKRFKKKFIFFFYRMLEILLLTFSVNLITFAPEVVGEAL